MKEIKNYIEWCKVLGYKPCHARTLNYYIQLKKSH